MNIENLPRRTWLQAASGVALGAAVGGGLQTATVAADNVTVPKSLRYCLNMSTVRGQKLSVPDQVDLAAKVREIPPAPSPLQDLIPQAARQEVRRV